MIKEHLACAHTALNARNINTEPNVEISYKCGTPKPRDQQGLLLKLCRGRPSTSSFRAASFRIVLRFQTREKLLNMAKFVIFLLCLGLFQAGSAIKCYNCQSSATNDCTDYSKVHSIVCNPLRDTFPPVCIRRVLKSALGTNITLQCIDKQTGNECDPPSDTYQVTDCKICQEDMCNSDSIVGPSMVSVFGLSLLYLMAK